MLIVRYDDDSATFNASYPVITHLDFALRLRVMQSTPLGGNLVPFVSAKIYSPGQVLTSASPNWSRNSPPLWKIKTGDSPARLSTQMLSTWSVRFACVLYLPRPGPSVPTKLSVVNWRNCHATTLLETQTRLKITSSKKAKYSNATHAAVFAPAFLKISFAGYVIRISSAVLAVVRPNSTLRHNPVSQRGQCGPTVAIGEKNEI